jgi:hypothetical protein
MSVVYSLGRIVTSFINYNLKGNIVNKNRLLSSNLRENKSNEINKSPNKQVINQKKEKMFISGTLKYDIRNEDDYFTIQSIKHSYDNAIEYDDVNKRFYIEYYK